MFFNLATVQVQELEFLILKSNRTPGGEKKKRKIAVTKARLAESAGTRPMDP